MKTYFETDGKRSILSTRKDNLKKVIPISTQADKERRQVMVTRALKAINVELVKP